MVSIITATVRRPAELARCIASVDHQTYEDWEHIIVSDGTDESIYPHNHPPRRQIVELDPAAHDWGSSPRNLGLLLAKGDLIAYLDDDNEWERDHLDSLVWAIGSADFAFSDMRIMEENRTIGTGKPEYSHIDTSCLLHRRGPISTHWPSGPYEADWQVVQSWLEQGAMWRATMRATVRYHVTPRPAWARPPA
jgi:GT2 family glycosyltransferase